MTVRDRIQSAIDHLHLASDGHTWQLVNRHIKKAQSELAEALLTLDANAVVDALPPGDPRRR